MGLDKLDVALQTLLEANIISILDLSNVNLDEAECEKLAEKIPMSTKLEIVKLSSSKFNAAEEGIITAAFEAKNVKCVFVSDYEEKKVTAGQDVDKNTQVTRKARVTRVDSSEIINNPVKALFASDSYRQKHDRKFLSALRAGEEKRLTIKQLPYGFTLLEEQELYNFNYQYGNPTIRYAGRRLDVANPSPIREAAPELQRRASHSKANREKAINLWKTFFSTDKDILLENEKLSMHVKLSNVDSYLDLQSREELYLPVAFQQENQPIGGGFLMLWESGSSDTVKYDRASLQAKPIDVVHTAACMFGATLYGKAKGMLHPLTNPHYKLPEGHVITEIKVQEDLHPDEILTRKMLNNFAPMIKLLCKKNVARLSYHLPIPNYIIYGINYYLNGGMTFDAFTRYVDAVKSRAAEHLKFLHQYGRDHGIQVETFSSLDALGFTKDKSKFLLSKLFLKMELGRFDQNIVLSEGKELAAELFEKILEYMSNQKGVIGEVWRQAKESIKIDERGLLQLNYIDYSAGLAVMAKSNNVCSLFPTHEKQISLGYKKLFAEKFGAILCINFLPPIQVCMQQYNDMVFYLQTYIAQIKALLSTGLVEASFLQTAALALDSAQLAQDSADRIYELLEKHQKDVVGQEIVRQFSGLSIRCENNFKSAKDIFKSLEDRQKNEIRPEGFEQFSKIRIRPERIKYFLKNASLASNNSSLFNQLLKEQQLSSGALENIYVKDEETHNDDMAKSKVSVTS